MPAETATTSLILVPGMGMQAADLRANGLIEAVQRRGWPVTVTTLDPGPDSYLDGSVEDRLLDGIAAVRATSGGGCVWMAGISLGCQGILRCVRRQPGLIDGALLLTPYLATTGLIAEVVRAGGLRRWATGRSNPAKPEHALLAWIAHATLPWMLVGRAEDDRFAMTADLMAEVMPAGRTVTVAGDHDWMSWVHLWRLMLDRHPFDQTPFDRTLAAAR
ncbi:MAG TPA: hypothetical protein VHB27_13950 [Rhodopila sp.]|uniref:alpha/beta fold hydrolase n=1 Tax=Rhodopila sp. TaxID=2480087 RepID=UPI002B9B600B|nr:hypothetical protein [Rhodopila sp.]HVY16324.1 hypothetical protein [Rhodopila sp.]